jgi:hypothetical protein
MGWVGLGRVGLGWVTIFEKTLGKLGKDFQKNFEIFENFSEILKI